MAITITKNQDGTLSAGLNNGHVEALKKIVKDYKLKGEEEALGFMLAVLSQGEGRPIKIGENNFVPSTSIQRMDGNTETDHGSN